ncbi:hypothetical protein [Streptomyces goshikiensis]|uniref:hypothetical protein n=1 Tax=Streptomyces goshikiensis TaxID=1942 RepID=UPI0036596C87
MTTPTSADGSFCRTGPADDGDTVRPPTLGSAPLLPGAPAMTFDIRRFRSPPLHSGRDNAPDGWRPSASRTARPSLRR